MLQLPAGITTRNSTCLCLLAASRPVRYALLRHRAAERRRNSNATRVRVRVRAMCAYADHSMRACVHLPLSLSISLALGRFLFVTHARTHSDSSMLHNRNSASCQSLDSLHRITYYVYVRSSSSSIFHYSILLCTRVVVAYSIFLLHPACLPSRRHSMCRPTVHYSSLHAGGGRSAHRSMLPRVTLPAGRAGCHADLPSFPALPVRVAIAHRFLPVHLCLCIYTIHAIALCSQLPPMIHSVFSSRY